MDTTLPSLLKLLEGGAGRPKGSSHTFLNGGGIRLFVLRNDGRIIDSNPVIERVKLWNIEGYIWLESEWWGIETAQVRTELCPIAPTEKLLTLRLPAQFQHIMSILIEDRTGTDAKIDKIFETELTEQIAKSLREMREPGRPRIDSGRTRPDTEEPFVFFSIAHSIETLIKYSDTVEQEYDLFNVLEEEKEGTMAQVTYRLRHANNQSIQIREAKEDLFDTYNLHIEPQPLPTDTLDCRHIPLETVLSLLEEQMAWASWLKRSRPTQIDALEIARYIHKSGDFQETYKYFLKNQPKSWEHGIYRSVRGNLLALLLSAATLPELNERISKKMVKHQINHTLFHIFYRGGLINQVLFKYAWVFGWAPVLPDIVDYKMKDEKQSA